jgi:hypothetical protein
LGTHGGVGLEIFAVGARKIVIAITRRFCHGNICHTFSIIDTKGMLVSITDVHGRMFAVFSSIKGSVANGVGTIAMILPIVKRIQFSSDTGTSVITNVLGTIVCTRFENVAASHSSKAFGAFAVITTQARFLVHVEYCFSLGIGGMVGKIGISQFANRVIQASKRTGAAIIIVLGKHQELKRHPKE